jgi:hypothetical protein
MTNISGERVSWGCRHGFPYTWLYRSWWPDAGGDELPLWSFSNVVRFRPLALAVDIGAGFLGFGVVVTAAEFLCAPLKRKQVSLRWVIVLVLAAGLACAGVRRHLDLVAAEQRFEMYERGDGDTVGYDFHVPSWLVEICGTYQNVPTFLQRVHMSSVQFSPNADPSSVACLQRLPRIDGVTLPATVNDADLEHLKALPSLKWLILDSRYVTDAGMKVIGGLRTLEDLNVGNCQITDAGLGSLQYLEGLCSLNLGGTNISGNGLKYLARMDMLERLTLSDTDLEPGDLKNLPELRSLMNLSVEGVLLDEADVARLQRIPSLTALVVTSGAISDDMLAVLKRANSALQVQFRPEATQDVDPTL